MKRRHGPCLGVVALLSGAAAGGACGGQASGDYDDGTGAVTGVGRGGMAGRAGGSGGTGGRDGQGGSALAGAPGRGGSATGGQGPGGSTSTGGSTSAGGGAGVAGASMGGSSGTTPRGTCLSQIPLGIGTGVYFGQVERASENHFDACPGNGPEQVISWEPPVSGRYLIDTFDSSFDTVLYVSSILNCPPTTPDAEQFCNDDFRGVQSLLAVEALAGQHYLIVVDSYNSTGGGFTLRFRGEAECPQVSLGAQLGDAVYVLPELADAAQLLAPVETGECRGGELGVSLAWQAPSNGDYRFSTGGSSFRAVLALREGCAGSFLACDRDVDLDNDSEVAVSLLQGQEIVIEVTAVEPQPLPAFGQLMLNIQAL